MYSLNDQLMKGVHQLSERLIAGENEVSEEKKDIDRMVKKAKGIERKRQLSLAVKKVGLYQSNELYTKDMDDKVNIIRNLNDDEL